jgi:hypothetical protein
MSDPTYSPFTAWPYAYEADTPPAVIPLRQYPGGNNPFMALDSNNVKMYWPDLPVTLYDESYYRSISSARTGAGLGDGISGDVGVPDIRQKLPNRCNPRKAGVRDPYLNNRRVIPSAEFFVGEPPRKMKAYEPTPKKQRPRYCGERPPARRDLNFDVMYSYQSVDTTPSMFDKIVRRRRTSYEC